jgi:hypothetical protein
MTDPVSAPAHYTSGTIECIDAIEAMLTVDEFRGFLRGNIVKYQWRYRQKGGAQDLDKSSWYLDRLKRLEASCPHCHRPHTDPMVCGRGGCPMGGDQ